MFDYDDIFSYFIHGELNTEEKRILDRYNIALSSKLLNASDKRKFEYKLGRFCALSSLKKAGFKDNFQIDTLDDGSPKWPDNFVGSITHSNGVVGAVCALESTYLGIGVDSQNIMSTKTFNRISKKIFVSKDADISLQNYSNEEVATLIFSFKESIYKCLRPLCGNFFGLQDAMITSIDEDTKKISYKLLKSIGKGFEKGFEGYGEFKMSDGFAHSICFHKNK